VRLTFRAKILGIVGIAAFTFVVLIVASAVISQRADDRVRAIRDQFLPKVELAPALKAQFDRLRRGLQDAVAAHDAEALDKTRETKDALFSQLEGAGAAIDPSERATLRAALGEYYDAAVDVSRRLMAGETGESLVSSVAAMQAKQTHALELLEKAAAFDRGELTAAFDSASRAHVVAGRVRLWLSIACLVLVIVLSLLMSRGMLRSQTQLTSGFERFGRGEFDQLIAAASDDEFGDLAEHANHMAGNLQRLAAERERAVWLERGYAALAAELRGELAPAGVAERATRVLATYLDALAAAFYALGEDQVLRPIGFFARADAATLVPAPEFAVGQGLVGQAAAQEEVMIVRDPPAGYLRIRSGLGESAPRAIVLLPLARLGKIIGVLELATLQPWSESSTELLSSVQETLAIAFEVAAARARAGELLRETQALATRLVAQEEELRQTNEELQAQQEELRQINDELSTQAEELQAQREMLEQRNAQLDDARVGLEKKAAELATVSSYKSQFLTNMSHELRTPLNSMLLLSSLLAENAGAHLTDKQVEYSRTIHSAGKDLLALINQVLDLAKVEAGKQETKVEQIPLRPLVEHVRRIFEPLANDKHLALVVEISPSVPEEITTDRQRLEQILRNLLGNAMKFTERGSVTLTLRALSGRVTLPRGEVDGGELLAFAVTDTGLGVAPEHQERIFAPFEQVEAASDRRHGGTGLGLAISRELAILLGGDLRLESTVGQGSTFTCLLPRAWTANRAAPGAPAPAPRSGASHEVLVIEDDAAFSSALAEIIETQGLEPLVATGGRAGLALARERRPRGVILDVRLPDLDGWRVMEQLRADPLTASIPVHFISAVDASARGLALGAIGYLTKPATRADLLRVVESLAPRRAARPCKILVTEDDAILGDSLVRQLAAEELDVQRVGTAGAALEAIRRESFDCMILDLSLPDTDGLELLQILEKECGEERPSVVIYTARALTHAETRRLESYAEAIVVKDGSSQERLLNEIRLFVQRLQDGRGPRRPPPLTPAPSDLRLREKKILLVDDDMRTVYALSAALIGKGAEVIVADNGRMALESLAARPDVDVVLMDIMMPEMDGYEAMRRIRKDARFAKLPIIALTAKAMKGDAEKCLEAGASDYMSKPIDVEQLLALMHARLSA
jgi:CheY-like chemotaxis protein/signal transduction histidine kinase